MSSRPGDLRFHLIIDGQIRQARDALGRYTRLQGEALKANRQLAEGLAAEAARNERRSRVRPKVATGQLESVIRRSWFADRDIVGVGIESQLDASEARYWRQIEGFEGRRTWDTLVGRRMVGYWTGPGGVRGFQRVAGRGGLGQRFVPTSLASAREVLTRQAKPGVSSRPMGIIRRGITAQRFYDKAFDRFLQQRTHERLYEQLFARADLPIRFQRSG